MPNVIALAAPVTGAPRRRARPPLTDRAAREATSPTGKIFYDGGSGRIAGFGLRVAPTGRKF